MIRPRRDRDRRREATVEKARRLLGSLKSYLMAREDDGRPANGAGGRPLWHTEVVRQRQSETLPHELCIKSPILRA